MTTPEPLDLDAIRARAERYKTLWAGPPWSPDGNQIQAIGETAEDVPALLAEVTALRAELDAARAERTEPATGEDVEVVAAALRRWWRDDTDGTTEELAEEILAALDLPGRERALREEIFARRADLAILTADRNDYAARLKATDASWAKVAAERDAANAALTDVARLLDEAREERDAWKERAGQLEVENARLIEAYDKALGDGGGS